MLPLVVQALGLINIGRHEHDASRAEEYRARQCAIEAELDRLDQLAREGRFAPEVVESVAPSTRTASELLDIAATATRATKSSARFTTKWSWS
jgi:hypothetical protein